jgi:retinol-binding protein 3
LYGICDIVATLPAEQDEAEERREHATGHGRATETTVKVPAPAFEPDATVLKIIGLLREHYVLTDKIESLVVALERRRRHGAYRGLQDRATFASVLTDELRTASGDGHLSVKLGVGEWSDREGAEDWERSERRRAIQANHGFASAQVLSGNVGYLRIAEFMEPQASLETATAAMRFVAGTRALIFDLRGYAGIPEYLATYLFIEGPPVLLSTFEYRPEKAAPDKTYTLAAVMGGRRVGTPAFVLVDHQTASAAEWFAYTLQAFQKARVVGESSAGGAHANEYFDLDEELRLSVSTGVPVSAVTGTNWESTGVVPDIACDPRRAIEVAIEASAGGVTGPGPGERPQPDGHAH